MLGLKLFHVSKTGRCVTGARQQRFTLPVTLALKPTYNRYNEDVWTFDKRHFTYISAIENICILKARLMSLVTNCKVVNIDLGNYFVSLVSCNRTIWLKLVLHTNTQDIPKYTLNLCFYLFTTKSLGFERDVLRFISQTQSQYQSLHLRADDIPKTFPPITCMVYGKWACKCIKYCIYDII